MVENVERFEAKLERLGFREPDFFHQRHVVVIESRPREKTAFGISGRTQGLQAEERGVEVSRRGAGVVVQIERARGELRLVNTVVVNAIWFGAEQGIVPIVVEGDGETGAEVRDAREAPAIGPTIRSAQEAVNRKLIVITDNEVLLDIEGGQSVAESGVDGVDFLPQI